MADIRIYTYEAGSLKKLSANMGKQFKNTVEEAREHIEKLKNGRFKDYQFVIVEYTATYQSKIIEVV